MSLILNPVLLEKKCKWSGGPSKSHCEKISSLLGQIPQPWPFPPFPSQELRDLHLQVRGCAEAAVGSRGLGAGPDVRQEPASVHGLRALL